MKRLVKNKEKLKSCTVKRDKKVEGKPKGKETRKIQAKTKQNGEKVGDEGYIERLLSYKVNTD